MSFSWKTSIEWSWRARLQTCPVHLLSPIEPLSEPEFPFCHPGPLWIIHPTAYFGAVFLIFPIPCDSSGPGRGQLWLLRVRKNLEVPHFKQLLRHLSVHSSGPGRGQLWLLRVRKNLE